MPVIMVNADDTWVKANLSSSYADYLRKVGNAMDVDTFIVQKQFKLLEHAPTRRALDMPHNYPKEHTFGCACYQVMNHYRIELDEIKSDFIRKQIKNYIGGDKNAS